MIPTLAVDEIFMIPVVAIVGVFTFLTVSSIVWAFYRGYSRGQLEQSRREVAAYVAEGSMSPEDAERLLNAGKSPDGPMRGQAGWQGMRG